MQETIFPDQRTKQYTKYDAASNLLSFTNRAGDPITYKYDELNRLVEKDSDSTITYTYDLAGKMLTATDSADTTLLNVTNKYDTAGRLTTTTQGSQSISYGYDNNSNITNFTYPGGKYYVTYNYDGNNLLTDIVDSSSTTLANFTYDTLFRRITSQYANSTSSSYDYNLGTEIKTLVHSFTDNTLEYAFPNYDDVGNVTTMTVNNSSFLPLTPEVGDGVIFDVNDLNQYTAQNGQQVFSYDNNGNLSKYNSSTFGYDRENRLTTATVGSNSSSYKYYPTAQRAQKTVNSQATTFVYYGDKVVWEQSPSATKYFVYEPGSDFPVYMKTDSDGYYYHYDNLGSVVALSGDSGTIAESYQYTPFGYSPTISSSIGNSYRYTARRLDEETGLYYTMARYYDPELRRFLQTDPLEYMPGMNMYAYVSDNPVNFYDPYGLMGWAIFTKTVKGAIKYISRNQAKKILKKKGTVTVSGKGSSKAAKKLYKNSHPGKKLGRHDAHKPGYKKHWQKKSGDGSHANYITGAGVVIPGANLGKDIFGDNWFGDAVNFFNPISDVQDIVNLVNSFGGNNDESK